jgi:hypothetical protein
VTIPGRGDLSPRRKRRNWRRRLSVLAVVVVVAGGGYAGYHFTRGGSTTPVATLRPCPSTTPTPPAALTERIEVRNATLKTGLAAEVAHALKRRDFRIGKIGNTLFRGSGVATIRYSTDRDQAARLLATQFDGATLETMAGSGVLELDIGPKYRSLVPVAQAQAAERAILASPTPRPSASASPTCAP